MEKPWGLTVHHMDKVRITRMGQPEWKEVVMQNQVLQPGSGSVRR